MNALTGVTVPACPCSAPEKCTHTGFMHTLDSSGDARSMWDKNNEAEVAAARRQFDDLTARGYVAYHAVGKTGDLGKRMRRFDPDAERIIFTRANQGG